MKKKTISAQTPSTAVCYETLESFARLEIQHWLQNLLEAEVTEFLGRGRHERGARSGYRNGYGKPRRLAFTAGTLTVQRPRLRNLTETFESKVLPLFKRQSADSGEAGPAFQRMPGHRSGVCRAGVSETGNALSLRWEWVSTVVRL